MGERTQNVHPGEIGATLERLWAVIGSRREADSAASYTARLLQGDQDGVLKKVVEEACEVALACKDRDHDHIRYEAADLVYHLLVALAYHGVALDELAGELDARAR